MNDLLRQIRNERRANLWLGVELLVVFAVMWYLVDWTYVTVRTWLQPMGFDTEHCYELTFNRLTNTWLCRRTASRILTGATASTSP